MATKTDDPFENDPLRTMPGDDADAGLSPDGGGGGDDGEEFEIEDEPEEEEELEGGDGDAEADSAAAAAAAAAAVDDEPEMSAPQIDALKTQINTTYINFETRKMMAERDLEPLKAAKETFEGNLEKLKAIKRKAREDKDRDRADQAEDLIEQTLENLDAVKTRMAPIEEKLGAYDEKLESLKKDYQALDVAPAPPEETAWKKANPWFKAKGEDEKSVYARSVAMKLYTDNKITPDSPMMWREVDRQLRIKFPDMRVAKKPLPSPNARPKPGSTASSVVAAGTGARSGASKGKITVPKGLRETWIKKGWDLKDLAKYAVRD